MNNNRSDSQLVAAYLGGDHAALGDMYDRYADRLYDTAAALLRDHHEAADCVQDTFVVAAQRIDQLRDADRLRPWLFAILRNEVYRRSRQRRRLKPTDLAAIGASEMTAADDPRFDAGALAAAELGQQIRFAAAGLDTRDQLILELTARQGLTGGDLADALGVSVQQSHVLLHRMRERFSRSMAALTVARMGRAECPQLEMLLRGWDGRFSVQIRKRVAGHIDVCEICGETQNRFAVLPMMSLAPALLAPAWLRDRTLTAAGQRLPNITYGFDSSTGFPVAPRRTAVWLKVTVVAAAVAVTLGVILGVVLTVRGGDPSVADDPTTILTTPVSAAAVASTGAANTTAAAPPPPAISVAPTAVAPTVAATTVVPTVAPTIAPTVVPTIAPTVLPSPGQLTVSSALLDLGSTGVDGTVILRNVGQGTVSWSLAGDPGPFVWSATSGSLAGGDSVELHLGIDRSALGEGSVSAEFVVNASAGQANNIQATASVEHSPQVTLVSAPTTYACRWSVAPMVSVKATDESTIQSMVVKWTSRNTTGNAAMNPSGPDQWRGSLAIEQRSATWVWTVTATDSRGNVATLTGNLVVSGC